jgi:hypothetical protein
MSKVRICMLTFDLRRSTFDSVRRLFQLALLVAAVAISSNAEEPPFYLGGRAPDDLPQLSDDELGTKQQQALLEALNGDAYGHRAADQERAGCAMGIRRLAIPSNTKHYGGYWVGGGLPCKGEDPALHEGTFGWDYFGMTFPKRIALNWSHGQRYQGGTGAYKTDGPRLQRR